MMKGPGSGDLGPSAMSHVVEDIESASVSRLIVPEIPPKQMNALKKQSDATTTHVRRVSYKKENRIQTV